MNIFTTSVLSSTIYPSICTHLQSDPSVAQHKSLLRILLCEQRFVTSLGTGVCRQNHWWSETQLQRKDSNKSANCNQFQNDLCSLNGGIASLLIGSVGKNATPAWWPRECFCIEALILSHILYPSPCCSSWDCSLNADTNKDKMQEGGNHVFTRRTRTKAHLVTLLEGSRVGNKGWSSLGMANWKAHRVAERSGSTCRGTSQPSAGREGSDHRP